jgi:dihydroneopterin aldolase
LEFFNRCISIRKFSLHVSIGFFEVEKLRPQRVLIDIELRLAPLVHEIPDDVGATVNYDLVHKALPKRAAGRHFNLQETLCHEILALCVGFDGVVSASVWVRKPDIYPDCESAGYQAEAGVRG